MCGAACKARQQQAAVHLRTYPGCTHLSGCMTTTVMHEVRQFWAQHKHPNQAYSLARLHHHRLAVLRMRPQFAVAGQQRQHVLQGQARGVHGLGDGHAARAGNVRRKRRAGSRAGDMGMEVLRWEVVEQTSCGDAGFQGLHCKSATKRPHGIKAGLPSPQSHRRTHRLGCGPAAFFLLPFAFAAAASSAAATAEAGGSTWT